MYIDLNQKVYLPFHYYTHWGWQCSEKLTILNFLETVNNERTTQLKFVIQAYFIVSRVYWLIPETDVKMLKKYMLDLLYLIQDCIHFTLVRSPTLPNLRIEVYTPTVIPT